MTSFIEDFQIIVHVDYQVEDVILDEISLSKCISTHSGAFVFNGELDIKLFEAVLAISVRHCPWLVCELVVHEHSQQVVVSPRRQDDPHPSPAYPGYLRCEIDDRSHIPFFSSITLLPNLYPIHVPENMLRKDLQIKEVDGIPICALRISQFQSHFLLSYRMNAAYYDQKSIIYYFTFLSSLYMNNGRSKIHPPIFLPCAHLLQGKWLVSNPSLLTNPTSTMSSSNTALTSTDTTTTTTTSILGKQFTDEIYPTNPIYRSIGLAHKFSITPDEEKIAEWKLQSRDIAISTNDLLHAVFIKTIAQFQMTKRLCSDQVVLKYARNMRPMLGVGNEIVGDYVKYESWQVPTALVLELTLLELAIMNRQLVSGFVVNHMYRSQPSDDSNSHHASGGRNNSNVGGGSSSMSSDSGYSSISALSSMSESNSQQHTSTSSSSSSVVADLNVLLVKNYWSHFPYDGIQFRTSKVQSLLLEDTKRMTNDDNHCGEVCVSFRTCCVDVNNDVYNSSRRELVIDVFSLYPALLEQLRIITEESNLFRR